MTRNSGVTCWLFALGLLASCGPASAAGGTDDAGPAGDGGLLSDADGDATDHDGGGRDAGTAADADTDQDQDGIPDDQDICPDVADTDQVDTDNDGIGDACDDDDGDGVLDIQDNCLGAYNPSQVDSDGDGIGDACNGLRRNERALQQILTTPLEYPYRVVLIGDVRTPGEERFAQLRRQILDLDPLPVFVVVIGDLVLHGTPEEYDAYEAAIDDFPIPIINVIGNHEVRDPGGLREFVERFGPTDQAFDYGKARFVWMNNSYPWGGPFEFTDRQFAWLDAILADPTVNDRFVFMHVPPKRPPEGHPLYDGHFFDSNRDGLPAGPDIMRLLERRNVTIAAFGHVHIYGNYVAWPTRYIVTGGGGAGTPDTEPAPWQDASFHHFVVLDILSPEGHDYQGHVVAMGDGADWAPGFDFDAYTGAQPVSLSLPWTEDFSSGDLSAWEIRIHYGPESRDLVDWRVEDGKLVQRGNYFVAGMGPPAAEGTYLCTWERSWTDVIFEVTLGNEDNDWIGVLFRYQDVDNYYRFAMNSQSGLRMLVRKLNGAYTVLHQDEGGYEVGRAYHIEVRAVGSEITVSIDGQTWATVTDGSLLSGGVGLYTRASEGAWFDDVSVREAP